jgi:ribosomal protein S18 acetylase RimI-like enzyme
MSETLLIPEFIFCDYTNPSHQQAFIALLNHYMTDPMGGCAELTPEQEKSLIDGMASHPSGFVLFAQVNKKMVGLATCFINFSTFRVKPYLNVHDIVVLKALRGKGVGRKLLEKCIDIARERDYCKVTLEVRDDNIHAQALYKSLGFKDCEPVMHFWTNVL